MIFIKYSYKDMVGQLKEKSDYDNRVLAANTFNQVNFNHLFCYQNFFMKR